MADETTPTPQTEPTSLAPASTEAPPQLNLFEEMAGVYESTAAGEVPTTQVEAVAAPAPVPTTVEAPPPPVEAAPPAPVPAEVAKPEAPAPQPQQTYRPPTTEELLARRAAWVQQLATQYSIPEDQVDLLATEPHKVLPNMAANIVANTFEAMTQYFNSVLPQYIVHTMQQQQMQRAGTDRFYDSWPQLRSEDPNVLKTISTVALAYRRNNPTASVEEAIEKVGAASSAMLGLPVNKTAARQPSQAPRTPSARPFSHSGPGLASGSMPATEQRGSSPQSDNFFADLVNGLDLSEI